jgi:hypothetical protein
LSTNLLGTSAWFHRASARSGILESLIQAIAGGVGVTAACDAESESSVKACLVVVNAAHVLRV